MQSSGNMMSNLWSWLLEWIFDQSVRIFVVLLLFCSVTDWPINGLLFLLLSLFWRFKAWHIVLLFDSPLIRIQTFLKLSIYTFWKAGKKTTREQMRCTITLLTFFRRRNLWTSVQYIPKFMSVVLNFKHLLYKKRKREKREAFFLLFVVPLSDHSLSSSGSSQSVPVSLPSLAQ